MPSRSGYVQVGINELAPAGELDEGGFLTAIALVALQTGDAAAESVRAVDGPALGNLGVQGCQFLVVASAGESAGLCDQLE